MKTSRIFLVLILAVFTISIFHCIFEKSSNSESSTTSMSEMFADSASHQQRESDASNAKHFCHASCCFIIGYSPVKFSFRFNATTMSIESFALLFDQLPVSLLKPPIA